MNKKACRVCFKSELDVYSLFQMTAIDLDGNEVPIHEMLKYCCSVEIDLDLPRDMCTKCADACTNAYNFIKQFRKSNEILTKSLKANAASIEAPVNVERDATSEEHLTLLHGSIEIGENAIKNESCEEVVENIAEQGAIEPIVIQTAIQIESTSTPVRRIVKKIKKQNRNYDRKLEVCIYCGKVYKGCLKYHEELHKNELKYECEICHEKFIAKDKVKYHRIKIHKIGSHICPDCGQEFCNKTQLRNHSWIHTGIKAYKCDNCGQQFSGPGCLKKHKIKNLCGKRKVYQPIARPKEELPEK